MATQKRWAVRESGQINVRFLKSDWYSFFVGRKPRKPSQGHWPHSKWQLNPETFEAIFPEEYHLPPGGGPVLIRLADEE